MEPWSPGEVLTTYCPYSWDDIDNSIGIPPLTHYYCTCRNKKPSRTNTVHIVHTVFVICTVFVHVSLHLHLRNMDGSGVEAVSSLLCLTSNRQQRKRAASRIFNPRPNLASSHPLPPAFDLQATRCRRFSCCFLRLGVQMNCQNSCRNQRSLSDVLQRRKSGWFMFGVLDTKILHA